MPFIEKFHSARALSSGGGRREDVGQVDLALVVVGSYVGEGFAQVVSVECVDTSVDFVDEGLFFGGVTLLDNGGHATAGIANNATVARGIIDARGQDGDDICLFDMGIDEVFQSLGAQHGNVAGGDDNNAVDLANLAFQLFQATLNGSSGAGDFVLIGDDSGGADTLNFSFDKLTLVAHNSN